SASSTSTATGSASAPPTAAPAGSAPASRVVVRPRLCGCPPACAEGSTTLWSLSQAPLPPAGEGDHAKHGGGGGPTHLRHAPLKIVIPAQAGIQCSTHHAHDPEFPPARE